MISRRSLLSGLAASFALGSGAARALTVDDRGYAFSADVADPRGWYSGYIPDKPYNIPFVELDRLPPHVRRQVVSYRGKERPGTIIVDTSNKHLYLIQSGGKAIRYGIGVGRDGFSWSGKARVGRKAAWPGWTPPAAMRRRQPELPAHMKGGLDNPLGARALYLYQGSRDTLYRIHGTNEPWSIGHAVSSGCIRMLNQDALDLYERVKVGATIKVREHGAPRGLIMSEAEDMGSLFSRLF